MPVAPEGRAIASTAQFQMGMWANHQDWTAGFSPWSHLPVFRFGYLFLIYSHLGSRGSLKLNHVSRTYSSSLKWARMSVVSFFPLFLGGESPNIEMGKCVRGSPEMPPFPSKQPHAHTHTNTWKGTNFKTTTPMLHALVPSHLTGKPW